MLFPYIEQPAMWEMVQNCENDRKDVGTQNPCDHCESLDIQGNLGREQLPGFDKCPSAPSPNIQFSDGSYGLEALAKGNNYAACWGSGDMLSWENKETRGAFGTVYLPQEKVVTTSGSVTYAGDRFQNRRGMQSRDFLDGLSNTMAMSEIISTESSTDIRGVWMSPAMGATIFSAFQNPNSKEKDIIAACGEDIADNSTPRLACTEERATAAIYAGARSYHVGGVNVLMADGGVRFVTESVDNLSIWRPLSTAQNKEVIVE